MERDLYRWRGLNEKEVVLWHLPRAGYEIGAALPADPERLFAAWAPVQTGDRKSTRLNSSHLGISYAVFCLKKKNHVNPSSGDWLKKIGLSAATPCPVSKLNRVHTL